jgi:putative membrane protein
VLYDSIKALHVVAIISWMAGLLYLPRLFVYHCAAPVGSDRSETFKVMERRLLKAIMTPAMIVSWIAGLYLAWSANWWTSGWFIAKLVCVIGLSAAHGFLAGATRRFAEDRNDRPARFYRIVNEVPTLLMVAIVAFVIVKPF